MHTFLRLLSVLPTWLLQGIGWLLGWAVFLCSPAYRQRFLTNARQAGYRFRDVRAGVGHAGRMVAELPKAWGPSMPPVIIDPASRALLDAAWQQQRGVLFLTPHMGCFELSSQAVASHLGLAEDSARGPMTVLYRPARKAFLARLLETVRNRRGQVAVPTDMRGVKAMLKCLRGSGAVGLLPDQVPPWGMGEWADFLGRPAYTMTIAARLIQQTDPIVIIARCERQGWSRYRLYLYPLELDAKAPQTALVHAINRAVEAQIRACPAQYMWGYARYKAPRGMPVDAPHPLRHDDVKEHAHDR